jgi:hypothetical protein
MGQLDDTARQLLLEMGYMAEATPTLDVLPKEAAKNLGLDSSSLEYSEALSHLVALGDIERKAAPDPALLGQALYQLTQPGFKRARELRWWRSWG